ncbi:hypothetical protein FSP39_007858 [Pinctada imbricata]|uniref:Uncharacterized protein n=1 Tax=Pinctada imbricata TaxID=66713 RepID=A0AA89C131_PINIB|nr:hypothetical protein FSP39_007858 [Pinctada imbricata]
MSGKELIHFAAMNDNDKVISLIIEEGANVNKLDNDNRTPLHYACRAGLVKNVRKLLQNDAKTNVPDSYGDLPIHFICDAVENHKTMMYESLRLLLEAGPIDMVNVLNDDKKSPLSLAACWPANRSQGIIFKLIEKGANVNLPDRYQNFPVISACSQGSFMNVRLLLRHGANPNTVDCVGRGLLHHAATKTYLDGWNLLSDWKVDVEAC